MMDDELFKNLVGKIVDKGKQNDILHPDVPDKEKMIEALSGLISYASSIDRTKGAEKDLFGAEYFFVRGFINETMHRDFPFIEYDFMEHCGNKLHIFLNDEIDGITEMRWFPSDMIVKNMVIQAMYNGAVVGDEYCIFLIKYLYRTYYKKEYNQIKRFKTMSADDVNEFGTDDRTQARILILGNFLGIGQDMSCSIIYRYLSCEADSRLDAMYEKEEMLDSGQDVTEEMLASFKKYISDSTGSEKLLLDIEPYHTAWQFFKKALIANGLPDNYADMHMLEDTGDTIDKRFVSSMVHAFVTIKDMHMEERCSLQDVQTFAALWELVCGLSNSIHELQEEISGLLSVDMDQDLYPVMFHPETSVRNKTAQEQKIQGKVQAKEEEHSTFSTPGEYLSQEIDTLRLRLREKEQETKELYRKFREAQSHFKEYEEEAKKREDERAELIALREFVYHLGNEKDEEIPGEKIDDMKTAIADKKIIIIGGHINWHNKIRRIFPKWTCLLTEEFKMVNGKALENRDKVYFFTDHMNHVAYEKYIKACRERKLDFGYLATVNLNQVIRQVYEDFC